MLPARSRIRAPAEHVTVTRRGRKVTRGPIVVHAVVPSDSTDSGNSIGSGGSVGPAASTGAEPRAGFVVGKKVGNAVVRNRVRRRLREQVRSRLALLPPGGLVIVRALPAASAASSAELGQALDDAFGALAARSATTGARAASGTRRLAARR